MKYHAVYIDKMTVRCGTGVGAGPKLPTLEQDTQTFLFSVAGSSFRIIFNQDQRMVQPFIELIILLFEINKKIEYILWYSVFCTCFQLVTGMAFQLSSNGDSQQLLCSTAGTIKALYQAAQNQPWYKATGAREQGMLSLPRSSTITSCSLKLVLCEYYRLHVARDANSSGVFPFQ